jgi:cell division septal protein FtsQ
MRLPGGRPRAGTPAGRSTTTGQPRRGRGATPIRARRRPGAQARRPREPLHARLGGRLPTMARLGALLGLVAALAGLVLLANGPWLRVGEITTSGAAWTQPRRLAAALDPLRGSSLLAIDRDALAAQLEAIPAVATARVETFLPDRLEVTITEEAPAFVWQTSAVQLVGGADGTVIGEVARGRELAGPLAALPFVDDRRAPSRDIIVGDRIPTDEWQTALRLVGIEPATLGSRATRLTVRIDEQYGFIVIANTGWSAAFGYYGLDPQEAAGDVAAQIDAQAASVRTLFAEHPETSVTWVDARNPGRVYWRAKG